MNLVDIADHYHSQRLPHPFIKILTLSTDFKSFLLWRFIFFFPFVSFIFILFYFFVNVSRVQKTCWRVCGVSLAAPLPWVRLLSCSGEQKRWSFAEFGTCVVCCPQSVQPLQRRGSSWIQDVDVLLLLSGGNKTSSAPTWYFSKLSTLRKRLQPFSVNVVNAQPAFASFDLGLSKISCM